MCRPGFGAFTFKRAAAVSTGAADAVNSSTGGAGFGGPMYFRASPEAGVRHKGMRTLLTPMFVSALAASSGGCGRGDEITADNVGDKLAQALCQAEDRCCAAEGAPSSSTDMLVCNGSAHALLYHLDTAVFSPAIAAACVKAAANYQCQFETWIEQLCRQVFRDPSDAGVGCASDSDCPQPPGGYGGCAAGGCISLLGGAGAVCSLSVAVYGCASYDGLRCVPDNPGGIAGKCQPRAAVGEACNLYSGECVQGADCDTTNVCVPWKQLGEACDGTVACVLGATCTTGGVCVAAGGCTLS